MRRIIASLFAVVVFAASVVAQAKHPFTFDDMMKLKRVGDPQVSPDGKWVIFSVVDVDLAANSKTPHVWIVPLDAHVRTAADVHVGTGASPVRPGEAGQSSSAERILIADQDADRPRWAPDGKRFAFLSNKDGGSQIWIADFDGAAGAVTAVHQFTHIATEASGELWSPDGKNILFTSDVYPECDGAPEAEATCNAKHLSEASTSKVKAQIFTHLLYRHWNAYKEGKRSHVFVVTLEPCNAGFESFCAKVSAARDLAPGDYDAPVFSLGGQDDYAFSPDGKEICYASNHDKNPAASTNNDLWIVPVDAGTDHVGTAASAVQSGEAGQGSAADAKVEHRSTRQPGAAVATQASVDAGTDHVGTAVSAVRSGEAGQGSAADAKVEHRSTRQPGAAVATQALVNAGTDHVGTAASAVQSGEAGLGSAADAKVELRSTRQPGAAVATQANVYVAEVLAQTKNITADNPASDSSPLYSPDGRYIAYRAQQRPGYESDRFRLMLYDRKTGQRKNLDDGFDWWTGDFIWWKDPSSQSSYIVFTTQSNGEQPIHMVSPSHFAPRTVVTGFNDDLNASGDGKWLLFTRMSLGAPIEIYRRSLTGNAKEEQLTRFNDDLLSKVSMSPLESFWFPGAHDDKVQGFLVKPPNFDASKKYPVKFLIHGGPQGAWGDDWSYRWNPELFASPTASAGSGYVVIMINFHGSTGYGQKFIDAINGDWGGAPYEDLMKGLDYAEKTYPFIDKDRECALGASYGGYAINWIMGHTNRFKCLVSHDGMFNAESAWGSTEEMWFNNWEFKGTPYDNRESYVKWSPHQYAKNFKTPTLVIHSQRDYRLDVSEGFQLFTTLQMQGVPSKMLYFPDEGHWIQKPQNAQLWYKTVNDWVDQWVGDKPAGK